jgi:hypothetical protein
VLKGGRTGSVTVQATDPGAGWAIPARTSASKIAQEEDV